MIGNTEIKGTEFRSLFNLRSTNIKSDTDILGNIIITTKGYGHGVGMSQCGANSLALKGKDYQYILQYYYTGVDIIDIDKQKICLK